jgi:hypothetical protein
MQENSILDDEEIELFIDENDLMQKLVRYMDNFCYAYDIKLNIENNHLTYLIETFETCTLILFKQIKNDNGWADSSYKAYMGVVRKILEFLTYIIHLDDNYVNSIYLDNYDQEKEKDYYNFLIKLSKSEESKNFEIIDGETANANNKKNYILLIESPNKKADNKFTYRPVDRHPVIAPTNKTKSHIESWFKTQEIDTNTVWRIFTLTDSKGHNMSSKGGFRSKTIPLETYEIINYIPIKSISLRDIDSIESKHELTNMQEKEVLSPILSNETAMLINPDFHETVVDAKTSIDSPYKQFLINKAISNSYINKNLPYRNDNTKPSLPKLKKFIKYCIEKNNSNFFIDISIFSILLGYSPEKIIYSMLNLDKDIKYVKKKSTSVLQIHVRKELFSEFANMKKNKLTYETSDTGEVYFIEEFEKKWQTTKSKLEQYVICQMANPKSKNNLLELAQEKYQDALPFELTELEKYIKKAKELQDFTEFEKYCDTNFSKKFIAQIEDIKFLGFYIDELLIEQKKLLVKIKRKYPKTIELTFKNMSTLFLYYYKVYNPNQNEFAILLTQNISKNDVARLQYASIPKRLISYETWIYKLTIHLGLDKYFNNSASLYIPQNIDYNKKIGSSNFFPKGNVKNFLLELNKLNFDDEIICFNVCMIYLRYIFSIQLVSRDITETSSNLSQFSKYFNILTIHEKVRNVNAGKKILPLTQMAIRNIEIFYKLRTAYNIESYSPVLLRINSQNELEEIDATRKNITIFFEDLNNEYEYSVSDYLFKFIKNTKLNFGRHIVTSEMIERGVGTSYIDACMNHYALGKEDQGTYSLFDNSKYIDLLRNIISEIEEDYIPSGISIEGFLWNLKI